MRHKGVGKGLIDSRSEVVDVRDGRGNTPLSRAS